VKEFSADLNLVHQKARNKHTFALKSSYSASVFHQFQKGIQILHHILASSEETFDGDSAADGDKALTETAKLGSSKDAFLVNKSTLSVTFCFLQSSCLIASRASCEIYPFSGSDSEP